MPCMWTTSAHPLCQLSRVAWGENMILSCILAWTVWQYVFMALINYQKEKAWCSMNSSLCSTKSSIKTTSAHLLCQLSRMEETWSDLYSVIIIICNLCFSSDRCGRDISNNLLKILTRFNKYICFGVRSIDHLDAQEMTNRNNFQKIIFSMQST